MNDPRHDQINPGHGEDAPPVRVKRAGSWAFAPALLGAFALGVVVTLAGQRLLGPRPEPRAPDARIIIPNEPADRATATADMAQASATAAETATAPPAAALTGIHPIIDATGGYLLGGVEEGKWVAAEKIGPALAGQEKYLLYSLARPMGEATGSKPEKNEVTDFAIALTPSPYTKDALIGVCGTWNALPRTPVIHNPAQKVYHDLVAAILRENGLTDAPVNVTQVIGIDLDGDEQQETLISATTPRADYPDFSAKKNDYSMVLLRKMVEKQMKTFTLYGDFVTADAKDQLPYVHQVTAVLDVNGDGVMEIIVGSAYYEGGAQSIYALQAGEPKRVVSNGAGL